MRPPGATGTEISSPPAVVARPQILTKRADYLLAARARRQTTPAFILQARMRASGESETDPTLIRIGYTCSKKVGNAVARNRAKRRLREIARLILPQHGQPGWDYVLIGRRDATVARAFAIMLNDLRDALVRLHAVADAKSN